MSPLTYIIFIPLLAAVIVALLPRRMGGVIRAIAILATLGSMAISLKMFLAFSGAEPGEGGYRFVQSVPWVNAVDINYLVGVDGINLGLVVMSAIIAFAAACLSYGITERQKQFYFLLLMMSGGVLGAFASLDLFFFYFFHELALVPTFIMIGVWGRGAQKNYATFQITMYLTVGALLALVGLIAIYAQSGANTFSIIKLTEHFRASPMDAGAQKLIFPFLLFGFGILVSLWPFHTWAPLGYGSAPTGTAMLHAGALKKFGLYGLIRIAIPLMPEGARIWLHVLAYLCLGNILYVGLVAMRQKDLGLLIGNSSVAHMGFVFLGIASLSLIGITGAVLVMIAHGFLAALSFGLSGYLYQQKRDLDMSEMGGLLKQMPFVGAAMMMAMLAGCGVPGFANFAGEILVLFGAWKTLPWIVVFGVWGALVIGGVYMTRAIRVMLHGPLEEKNASVKDIFSLWHKLPYALLLAGLLLVGFFPRLLTEKIRPDAEQLLSVFHADAGAAVQAADSKSLPDETPMLTLK